MKLNGIIFDLFGTLSPFDLKEEERFLAYAAKCLEVSHDQERFINLWREETYNARHTATSPCASIEETLQHICAKLGKKPRVSSILAVKVRFVSFIRWTLCPRRDAITTLSELQKKIQTRNGKIGLISDCPIEVPPLYHKETPFPNYIVNPVFSCILHIKKPNPEIFLTACRKLDVSPTECIYVGDGGSDELNGAARVGMYPILIYEEGKKPSETWEEARSWKGERISELYELLPTLEKYDPSF